MCILCGDFVDLFKCIFDFVTGSLSLASKLFTNGMCLVTRVPATKLVLGLTVHLLL